MLALDTSVAVPLLVASHRAHRDVVSWCGQRDVALSGHAVAETYAVLTRLPGDARLSPLDAARLMHARFAPPLLMDPDVAVALPDRLAEFGIAGGAVYDALVGLAAKTNHCVLATRDARAKATYDAIGVDTEIAA